MSHAGQQTLLSQFYQSLEYIIFTCEGQVILIKTLSDKQSKTSTQAETYSPCTWTWSVPVYTLTHDPRGITLTLQS